MSSLGGVVADIVMQSGFSQQQSGLNDLGQITFRFHLADGRSGIALWTVPGRDVDSDADRSERDRKDNVLN